MGTAAFLRAVSWAKKEGKAPLQRASLTGTQIPYSFVSVPHSWFKSFPALLVLQGSTQALPGPAPPKLVSRVGADHGFPWNKWAGAASLLSHHGSEQPGLCSAHTRPGFLARNLSMTRDQAQGNILR